MTANAQTPDPSNPLRIGTRASPLAMAQSTETARKLCAAHGWPEDGPDCPVEVVAMSTKGDREQSRALLEIGGKGLFTKDIEDALLDGRVDLAVHSMKDMPTVLPRGLVMAAMLERENPRDVFIGHEATRLEDLPPGAVVGTVSLRRQSQLLALRPDVKVGILRGNVATRMEKVKGGELAGTFLARAGLNRLGHGADLGTDLDPEQWVPAVAQGAIGIEIRESDDRVRALLQPLRHGDTEQAVAAERAFLAVLDGSCRTPIAGHASLSSNALLGFHGVVLTPDGKKSWTVRKEAQIKPGLEGLGDAAAMGESAGLELKAQMKRDGVSSADLTVSAG